MILPTTEATPLPVAGTRPRGKTDEEDRALEQKLLGDPKECAEHLVLIDLGRNDVGRVSEVGSVRVTDRMVIEGYSHVMHIVSNVCGKVGNNVSGMDVYALFLAANVLCRGANRPGGLPNRSSQRAITF